MFLLDSLMISGIRWAIETVVKAADAEMNDDTALREQLLEAEMRRETGEISDDEFVDIEADLLARIREIKERREGGAGPLAFGDGEPIASSPDSTFQIEATVTGDFHGDDSNPTASGDVTTTPTGAMVTPTRTGKTPRKARARRTSRTTTNDHGTTRTSRSPRTPRTTRTSRTIRTK